MTIPRYRTANRQQMIKEVNEKKMKFGASAHLPRWRRLNKPSGKAGRTLVSTILGRRLTSIPNAVQMVSLWKLQENWKLTKNPNEVIYSELTIARVSVTISCIWQRLKGRQGSEKDL